MKVYDKEIYSKQESIKVYILIAIVFLLGFFAGYIASSFGNSNKIKENQLEQSIQVENIVELK